MSHQKPWWPGGGGMTLNKVLKEKKNLTRILYLGKNYHSKNQEEIMILPGKQQREFVLSRPLYKKY